MAAYQPLSDLEVEGQVLTTEHIRKGGGWVTEEVEGPLLSGVATQFTSNLAQMAGVAEEEVELQFICEGPLQASYEQVIVIGGERFRVLSAIDPAMTGMHSVYALAKEQT